MADTIDATPTTRPFRLLTFPATLKTRKHQRVSELARRIMRLEQLSEGTESRWLSMIEPMIDSALANYGDADAAKRTHQRKLKDAERELQRAKENR